MMTGYIPDIDNKQKMVCVEYMTKHSMEEENWKGIEANSAKTNFS